MVLQILKKNLFIICWCLAGAALMELPRATVLNNPSAGTDFFIPLIGAWGLECGALHHTPLGVGFYLPYEAVGWLFGYTDATVRYTQALLFIIVSGLAWSLLSLRLNQRLAAIATAYLSLYATSPVNVGDSPFISYDSLYYDLLPIALGQLAIICALFPSPNRQLDRLAIAGLLLWEGSIKINLALPDVVLVAAALVFLHRDIPGALLAGLAGGLMALQLFNPDFARASQARLQNLLNEPVPFLQGNLTWGVAGFWSRMENMARDTFWAWSIPAAAAIAALAKIGRRAAPFAIVLALVAAADVLRCLSNSVSLTAPFTVLLALAYTETQK